MKRRNHVRRYLFISSFSLIIALPLLLGTYLNAFCLESPDSSDFQDVKINTDVLKGIHLLYNYEFNGAEKIFQKVITEFPHRPIGYFYLAMVTWSKLASGFWSPEIVNEYDERIDTTIQIANIRIKNNVADSFDFFYLGGALGFKGRFELMKGKWVSSFFAASNAVEALKTCLNMDPNNRDVLLGLGIFDYYTARLSGVLKFLSYLLLHKGNKDEGLRKLNIAAKEAVYSKTEAKSMLLHIYLFGEKDFLKALPFAEYLEKRYDKNPRFKLLKGVNYICLDMDLKYRNTLNDLRQRSLRVSSSKIASLWHRRALYLESINYLFHADYLEARARLKMILEKADPENDPEMIAWPIVKIGMSYDLEGNREEAIKYYRQVLKMENGSGAQFLAKKFLNKPPKEKDPMIGY
ncbi:MAG: tetratricopeptide repeat protein [Deltaproteobacteria bacterium]|nr:tetratricopeptide repeat protein [Deltaproteobacteria bacterium]